MCRYRAEWYSDFVPLVKPELELAFYELCLDIVLHIGIVAIVDFGEMPDISGVVGEDGVHVFRLALMRPDNGFIGEKLNINKKS